MKAQPAVMTPASHRHDPDTSKQAERHMNTSGERSRQQRQVYDLVCGHPNSTSEDLARHGILGYHQIARRMKELVTAGMVEAGTTRRNRSGRMATVWHPTTKQWDLF